MASFVALVLLFFLSFAGFGFGEGIELPKCASPCLDKALAESQCSGWNPQCLCAASSGIFPNASCCVKEACANIDKREQLSCPRDTKSSSTYQWPSNTISTPFATPTDSWMYSQNGGGGGVTMHAELGLILGSVLGGLSFIIAAVLLGLWYRRRRSKRASEKAQELEKQEKMDEVEIQAEYRKAEMDNDTMRHQIDGRELYEEWRSPKGEFELEGDSTFGDRELPDNSTTSPDRENSEVESIQPKN